MEACSDPGDEGVCILNASPENAQSKNEEEHSGGISPEKGELKSLIIDDEEDNFVKHRRRIIDDEESEEDTSSGSKDNAVQRHNQIIDEEEEDLSSGSKNNSVKHRRRIIDDDDGEEDTSRDAKDKSNNSRNRIVDDDEEEERSQDKEASRSSTGSLNHSKVVMRNLKSLCDDESSDEENDRDDESEEEENHIRKDLVSSSNSNHELAPTVERPKNPTRASKTECENAISLIQKNAREDQLEVPYHCPEQKSLKEFLESLKITKSKLVTEEKVEVKTTKYKLLKDLPRKDIASLETQALDSELERESDTIPKRDLQSYGSGKLTLKGSANSMIDLETGKTFVKTTCADSLILKMMRNNNLNVPKNANPKFKPEPIPGAPLKRLKQNLESELDRKRKETILKILEVEKVAKEDEEEILNDEEYELDSDDDTRKKKTKKKAPETEANGKQDEDCERVEFNEDEEEMTEEDRNAGDGEEEEMEAGEQKEDADSDDDAGSGEEEEEDDSEDDDDDQLEDLPKDGNKELKRIVPMEDDSDDEIEVKATQPEPGHRASVNVESEVVGVAPLFEDIPTEGLKSYEFSATQNDNELFDLCSGNFTTQLPPTDVTSQAVVEASQVRGFDLPTSTAVEMTQNPDPPNPGKDDCTDEVAGPQIFNLSSSEEEDDGGQEAVTRTKRKTKRKKKRVIIEEDEDDGDDLPKDGDDEFGEEEEYESDEELLQAPVEGELEEYESFLTGQVTTDPQKPRMKVTDFIEKEAELSDSEWGSEDEDERGLDKIEDIGLVRDDEDFDGEQLRDEVGRIHMRQMVNEDNRELKYLKDMILNEEELDGQVRQRTFRWLNVNNDDDAGFGENEKVAETDDLENHSSDDENEEKWRKNRYEREQTILSNKAGVTIESKLETVMRQTRDIKVIKSVNSGEVALNEITSPSFLMQDQSKKYMNLRQSFLLRDEVTLNRLATFSAKDSGNAVTDGKQNFVFRRIEDANKPAEEPELPKKRKSNGFQFERSSPAQKKRKE